MKKLPKTSHTGTFKLVDDSVVLSLNPRYPDIGTHQGRVYEQNGTISTVWWGDGWVKSFLTPTEVKQLNRLLRKCLKNSKYNNKRLVEVRYSKRRGFTEKVIR